MIFEKKITKSGGSKSILIPKDIAKYLDLDFGTEILMMDEKGKHGKYISFWRKDQKQE